MTDKANGKPKSESINRKSLEECRRILHADEAGYNDEEVLAIRDFLISIVELDYKQFQKLNEQKTPIINLNSENDAHSNFIHPSKYRRAS